MATTGNVPRIIIMSVFTPTQVVSLTAPELPVVNLLQPLDEVGREFGKALSSAGFVSLTAQPVPARPRSTCSSETSRPLRLSHSQLLIGYAQSALRAAITMGSSYPARGARVFSQFIPALRTTRAPRRARATPRVQKANISENPLVYTGIVRCTIHNAHEGTIRLFCSQARWNLEGPPELDCCAS